MRFNVLLVEDDEIFVAFLKRNLSFYSTLHLVSVAGSVSEAVYFAQNNHIDVVFLDIQLPDGNGFDIIPHLHGKPAVVVITNHESYAFTAFEHGVLDFLKKTFMPKRFKACIDKVLDYLHNHVSTKPDGFTFLFVKSGLKHLKIDIRELVYTEAVNEYVRIYFVKTKPQLINASLKQLISKLQGYGFIQVHRSYLVNLQHIDYIDDGVVVLNNAVQIPIGRTFKNEVQKFLR